MMNKYLNYSLKLLSIRAYTIKEMTDKLIKKKASTEDIDNIINKLVEWGYLNDEELARNWIQQRIRINPRGKELLKKELLYKGINEEIIYNIIDEFISVEIELESAKHVAEKYYKTRIVRLEKEIIINKLYSHLARKGFSSNIIRQVLIDYH